MNKSNYFAEVTESFLTHYKAQSWEHHNVPAFGSVVIAEYQQIKQYALVYQSNTGSDDPVRQVYAYQKTQQELAQEQPHIFALMRTWFSVVTIGYIYQDEPQPELNFCYAPVPAPLHTFVRYAYTAELALITDISFYVPLLFERAQFFNVDQLILAVVKQLKVHKLISQDQLCELVSVYMHTGGHDYNHVRLFARQLE